MPIDEGPGPFGNATAGIPLCRKDSPITRHYCAFWKTDNSSYYVEDLTVICVTSTNDAVIIELNQKNGCITSRLYDLVQLLCKTVTVTFRPGKRLICNIVYKGSIYNVGQFHILYFIPAPGRIDSFYPAKEIPIYLAVCGKFLFYLYKDVRYMAGLAFCIVTTYVSKAFRIYLLIIAAILL